MHEVIRTLEASSQRAWPALETQDYDGWTLRFAAGYTRRANSVSPLGDAAIDVGEKLRYCEALYRERGITIAFKMTHAALPADLDPQLAQHGYQVDPPLSAVYAADLMVHNYALDGRIDLQSHPEDRWLETYCALNTIEPHHLPTMRAMLTPLETQAHYVTLCEQDETAAMGLGVHEGQRLWLFDIVTAAQHRGRGLGRALVASLLHLGKINGAKQACLQVAQGNEPALRLYQSLGFREIYHYWYRVKK